MQSLTDGGQGAVRLDFAARELVTSARPVPVKPPAVFVRMVRSVRLGPRLHRLIERLPSPLRQPAAAFERHWKIRTRRRLVPEEALAAQYREVFELLLERGGVSGVGDYLEFGVFNGTSLAVCWRVVNALGLKRVRLFGFDSFQGLPLSAHQEDGGHWEPGQFKSEYEFTRQVLDDEGVDWERVSLVRGYFDETLTEQTAAAHGIRRASLIMVDCDLCSSARQALEWCVPRMAEDAFVFFDDWYPLANRNLGEKRALEEFLADHPEFSFEAHPTTYHPQAKIFRVARTVPTSVDRTARSGQGYDMLRP